MTTDEIARLESLWSEWQRKEVTKVSYAEQRESEARVKSALFTAGGMVATSRRVVASWKVKYESSDDPLYKTAALHSAVHNTICQYMDRFAKEEGYAGAHINRQMDVGRAVIQEMNDFEIITLLDSADADFERIVRDACNAVAGIYGADKQKPRRQGRGHGRGTPPQRSQSRGGYTQEEWQSWNAGSWQAPSAGGAYGAAGRGRSDAFSSWEQPPNP